MKQFPGFKRDPNVMYETNASVGLKYKSLLRKYKKLLKNGSISNEDAEFFYRYLANDWEDYIWKYDATLDENILIRSSVKIPDGVWGIDGQYRFDTDQFYGISLEFSSSVKRVVENSFPGCYLSSLKLNDGLEYIGDYAFYTGDPCLSSVYIPSSVKWIGTAAFRSPNTIILDSNYFTHYSSVHHSGVYNGEGEEIEVDFEDIFFLDSGPYTLVLGDNIQGVDFNYGTSSTAFNSFSNLSTLVVGKNVKYFNPGTVDGHLSSVIYASDQLLHEGPIIKPGADNIIIGSGITKLSSYALCGVQFGAGTFSGTNIFLPPTLKTIENSALNAKGWISSVLIPENVTELKLDWFNAKNINIVVFIGKTPPILPEGTPFFGKGTIDRVYCSVGFLCPELYKDNYSGLVYPYPGTPSTIENCLNGGYDGSYSSHSGGWCLYNSTDLHNYLERYLELYGENSLPEYIKNKL